MILLFLALACLARPAGLSLLSPLASLALALASLALALASLALAGGRSS